MPRISLVESPGCPPLRALTFDTIGLVKVVEARGKQGIPTIVDRWGEPDASRCVTAASMTDDKKKPLLAVARKNGLVEVLNHLNGDVCTEIRVSENGSSGHVPLPDLIVGLHMFKAERIDSILTCTVEGNARILSRKSGDQVASWAVCNSGKVLFSSVDDCDNHALFGGRCVEVSVWDIDNSTRKWIGKSPPPNNLGISTATWFTAATFLGQDHRKLIAGTYNHQVRLYDISAQRKPVLSVDFSESSIMSVAEDLDGHTVFVGTARGDLASFDMRTGRLLGCFTGKCCGCVKSISRHPTLSMIASCGLDNYLRFWDSKTRKPLYAVYLKQHLVKVVFDASFNDKASMDVGREYNGVNLEKQEASEGNEKQARKWSTWRAPESSRGENLKKIKKGGHIL